jgi:glycine betaine/proline transport system substrate-binding protein
MKAIIRYLAAMMLVFASAVSAYAQEKVIKMGTLSWEDVMPITLITKKFLEKEG